MQPYHFLAQRQIKSSNVVMVRTGLRQELFAFCNVQRVRQNRQRAWRRQGQCRQTPVRQEIGHPIPFKEQNDGKLTGSVFIGERTRRLAEQTSKLDSAERDDDDASCSAGTHWRRPVLSGYSLDSLFGRSAERGSGQAAMAAAGPIHPFQRTLFGSVLFNARSARFFPTGAVENLHGPALDVEWASGPQQVARRGGQHGAPRTWFADCDGCSAGDAHEEGGVARLCADRRW